MSLKIGIVGLPNVGKSTLFKSITKQQVDNSNYPFCTIDPNVGIVLVPDERVDKLARLMESQKKIYAPVEFVDIAGLVEGAHKGEGLGNQFLSHIREVDVVIYVLRCFSNDKIINTRNEINIIKDKEILDTEMALKDLATLEKRIHSLGKEERSGNKEAKKEKQVLEKAQELLGRGEMLTGFEEDDFKIIKSYQLLTSKPRIYLLNGSEKEVDVSSREVFKKNNWPFLVIDVLTESEACDFTEEERESFGLEKSKLNVLIKETYRLLDLITFLTTGQDETRAWNLKRGSKAPQAGGVIHTDFEHNFIKAEVINWKDLIDCSSFLKAREKGLLRTEGKDYVVQDGDVIEIKAGV